MADGAVTSFYYDPENRLTWVGTPTTTVQFRYDALGRRLERTVTQDSGGDGEGDGEEGPPPRVTRYLYDQEDILATFNQRDRERARYLHGPGIDEPLAQLRSTGTRFYHTDVLGTIIALTDPTGTLERRYRYDAYEVPQDHRKDAQPYRFTGREWDRETGLYYYRARYYAPATGRFIAEDPIDRPSPVPLLLPLRLRTYPAVNMTQKGSGDVVWGACAGRNPNEYVYAKNAPVIFIDPSGAMSQCAWEGWKTFGLCALGTFVAIDIPLSIGVAGCMTLGPVALPCAAAVLGIYEHVELVALTACAASGVETYQQCEGKEDPCGRKR